MDTGQEDTLSANAQRKASPAFVGEPPWERGLASPYLFRLLMAAGMFVFCAGYTIVAFSMFMLMVSGTLDQGFQDFGLVDFFLVFFFFVLPASLILPIWRWFGRIQRWSSLGKGIMMLEIHQSQVCFLPIGMLVWLNGPGEFAFSEGALRLTAERYERDSSVDKRMVAGAGLYALIPLSLRWPPFFAPLLVITAVYYAYKWAVRRGENRHASSNSVEPPLRPRSVEVELLPKDVSRVRCSGPLIELMLSSSASKRFGVRRIRLVIRSDLRRDFFFQFGALFPSKLPRPYQEAVASETHP